jgi:protein gp37
MTALTQFPLAQRNLAEARTINEVQEIIGYYEGIKRAAEKLGNREAKIEAAEFIIRAQRKLGQMMEAARKAGALAKGGGDQRSDHRGVKSPGDPPTLADQGVDKDLAKSARKLSKLSDEEFDEGLAEWHQSINGGGGRITTTLPTPPNVSETAAIRANISQWKQMSEDEQRELLLPRNSDAHFNKQDSDAIEWAQWSWNPITGCEHDCPYCYARDIAERFRNIYPHGFEPALHPYMLNAPGNTPVPDQAASDTRYKNVFTGSMSDIFGRWLPCEWIEAVLDRVRKNPQWNFLFLTKFPKRMAEFSIPANAWMGTTVDLQARVANAEAAFAKLTSQSGIRWLSIEPMLEPLKFTRLDLFNWIVIGGASRSSQTPEFRPPLPWIIDLCQQASEAGCAVYMKTNLLGNRILQLPFDAPIKGDPTEASAVFHYLGKP